MLSGKTTAAAIAVALATAAGCGARTELATELRSSGGAAGTTAGGGAPNGGAPNGGSGGTSSGGTAGAAGSGGLPPLDCYFAPHGDPFELLSFPEGNTDTPLMAVLDAGETGPAELGYAAISEDANFWHPELRVGKLVVGEPWPDGVKFSVAPVLYGFDSHAWGAMTHAADPNANALALAFYHADEASPNVIPALKFRPFDAAAWAPGNEVVVDTAGSVVNGFVAGASIANGAYSGLGYGVVYRATNASDPNLAEPRLAVLDAAGGVQKGPITLTPATPYPGTASGLTWTGETYLVATTTGDCGPTGDCIEPSVIIRSLDPGAPSGNELTLTASIPPLDPATTPRRATMASHAGHHYVLWSEAPATPDDAPRTVRLAELTSGGALAAEPIVLATDAHPVHALSVIATDLGVVAYWGEATSPSLPDNAVGNSALRIYYAPLGGAQFASLSLPTTSFAYGLPASAVAVKTPLSVLISWGATSVTAGGAVTWLARLDCELPLN